MQDLHWDGYLDYHQRWPCGFGIVCVRGMCDKNKMVKEPMMWWQKKVLSPVCWTSAHVTWARRVRCSQWLRRYTEPITEQFSNRLRKINTNFDSLSLLLTINNYHCEIVKYLALPLSNADSKWPTVAITPGKQQRIDFRCVHIRSSFTAEGPTLTVRLHTPRNKETQWSTKPKGALFLTVRVRGRECPPVAAGAPVVICQTHKQR